MNRCLHINIQEGSAATPPRKAAHAAHFPGWTSTDPGEDHVMPKPDDPPTDPGEDHVMPKPDDPSGTRYASGDPGGCGDMAVTVGSCCCGGCHCGCGAPAATSSTGTAKPHPFIAPSDFSGFVIVRMVPGLDPKAMSLWELAGPEPPADPSKPPRLPGLKAVLELPFKDDKEKGHLVSRPLIELQGPIQADRVAKIRDLEKKAALTPFAPQHSLADYWRLDVGDYSGLVEEVVAQLNSLPEVDLAYRELTASDPQKEMEGKSFAEDEGYLRDAPVGIGAAWAWESLTGTTFRTIQTSKGSESTGKLDNARTSQQQQQQLLPPIIVCDLEQGWVSGHNDLKDEFQNRSDPHTLYGANRADPAEEKATYPGHHGTAVLGQLAATGQSPQGVKGAVTGLSQFKLASHYLSKNAKLPEDSSKPHPFAGNNGYVAAAIVQVLSLNVLQKGDILLIEVQRGRLPAETDEADFDAIRLASGLGIIVVEAAGNGGFDLDAWRSPDTGRSFKRGDSRFLDSGATFVGASWSSLPHDRANFSNYGSRIDCFAWGDSVTTCGYGDLAGSVPEDLYTSSFSGTSSASPIIAGAAALLQALHLNETTVRLDPSSMRSLLSDSATGTPQGPNVPGHIGVMPDLQAIIRSRLQLVPVVYMRRSLCDDGSKPGPDEEVSSSPDILLRQDALAPAAARYAEGSGRENLPAPGDPMVTANLNTPASNHLYVRLRNRGLGAGETHLHLFASPVATLLTPERWTPWGALDVTQQQQQNVPQGDTLLLVGPVSPVFNLATPPPDRPWSFLAVLFKPGAHSHPPPSSGLPSFYDWTAGLPPSPPYFDWTAYRAFLRQPGVAIRNAHRIANPSQGLPFYIAGAPDCTRRFDFEVIQRLPAGVSVKLQVPPALDAKLRQRLPWTGATAGTGSAAGLALPKRPRTLIRGVALAAGTYADSTFVVSVPTGGQPPGIGHSLAIRQLWHGEEVGRITWYFTLDT